MSITGSATHEGVTFSSNTLSDEQIRESLGTASSDTVTADVPKVETPATTDIPPVEAKTESTKKKYDATKDPEVRIGKATAERERAREAERLATERADRIQREYDDFRAQSTKPAEPAHTSQPATATAEPKLEDFSDAPDPYAAYVRALAKFDREQDWATREKQQLEARTKFQQEQTAKQREQAEQTRIAAFGTKLQQALAADPALEQVMADSDIEITRPMADAIIESDAPEKLIAHLHANRDEVTRILGLSPLQQFRALARLDAQLESPAASGQSGIPAQKKTAAQPPISPVSGSVASPATGPPDPKTCTQEEWNTYWNTHEQAQRTGARR